MRWLTEDEQKAFRDDYRDVEREVQKYIGVYLTGLVLVIGWIMGPQSKPLIEMALGNQGLNIFGLLLLAALNSLFTSFLIYKSLQIHEITQFMTVLSDTENGFMYWEQWRRSPHSTTNGSVRNLYYFQLSILPLGVSALIMFSVLALIRKESSFLIGQLQATGNTVSPQQLSLVLWWAFIIWLPVAALHLIPLYYFYVNVIPTKARWDKIDQLKMPRPLFRKNRPLPLLPPSLKPEEQVNVYVDNQTITLSGQQLSLLIQHLNAHKGKDDTLALDKTSLGSIAKAGADAELVALLNESLKDKKKVLVSWDF